MMQASRKKQLIYGLLLGGAFAALAIDRMTGGGPAVAQASRVSRLRAGAANDKTPAKDTKGPAIARVFEQNFNGKADKAGGLEIEEKRDAFSLTPEMRQVYETKSSDAQSDRGQKVEDEQELRRKEAEEFVTAHKLKGTSLENGGAWALIDDSIVRIGEQVDGYELQKVEHYRVQLKKGEIVVSLTLPTPF